MQLAHSSDESLIGLFVRQDMERWVFPAESFQSLSKLVGIVTEDTIIQYVFNDPTLMNAPVGDAMESAFIQLPRDTSVNNLVAMLRVQPYAAIMDGDEFLGLITRSDVLNYMRRQM